MDPKARSEEVRDWGDRRSVVEEINLFLERKRRYGSIKPDLRPVDVVEPGEELRIRHSHSPLKNAETV